GVGNVSIPLDNGWNNRLFVTGTKGSWQRFTKTFTPAPADCAFKARVLSETITPGFLIDDVCLVEGDSAEPGKNLIPNGDFETSWSAQRVARELPDMEKMTDRLGQQLADAKPFPKVPRWDGAARPHIAGPSFVAADGRPI